ncbi:MAG: transposase family protein [Candidatus Hydrothermae bacterium]|nr:transposase family protein [Candidatus Hydrothermae bacterium]
MGRRRKKAVSLRARREVIRVYAKRYRAARTKHQKSRILDELLEVIPYNRNYAAWLLRNVGKRVQIWTPEGKREVVVYGSRRPVRRRRKRIYGQEVQKVLRKIWAILDYPCSRRLKAMLPEVTKKLIACGELEISEEIQRKLLQISASTIDRLLVSERRKLQLKPRAKTRPGTLLKKQIAIRTHAGWEEGEPGYLEIDLISHDGGNARGDYAWTLVLTDVETQWTELIPIRNRAQVWTLQALEEAEKRFPFPIRGLDCDNDSVFINRHLLAWCQARGVKFTRSRPYWKNDNCHVEQKNWSVGRRYLGYFRYDTEIALEVLKMLGVDVSVYVNYFQASMRLKEKRWEQGRLKRVYDPPLTPYARVLAHPAVSEEIKHQLRQQYASLNPAALRRKILRLQKRLFGLATPVEGITYA